MPLQKQINASLYLQDVAKSTRDFYHREFWMSCVGGGILLVFAGVAGGFWTSLLFRQTGAALWFAILIPGVILVASEIFGHLLGFDPNFILFPTLAIYATAGFVWARRMFLKRRMPNGSVARLLCWASTPNHKPQPTPSAARNRWPR